MGVLALLSGVCWEKVKPESGGDGPAALAYLCDLWRQHSARFKAWVLASAEPAR